MAIETPVYCLQAAADKHSAELFRRAISTLLSAAGGIVTARDFQISEHVAANMSINIAAGEAWVPGTSTASQGQYYVRNTATINQAISAADATNPRVEKVVLRIKDEAYSGSESLGLTEVIKGTAEAGATLSNRKGAGATPASSLVLGFVLVPAKATSITGVNIENVTSPFGVGTTAWQNLTAATKTEIPEAAQWRLEQGGTVLRLRGFVEVKAGQTLSAGEPVASGGWTSLIGRVQQCPSSYPGTVATLATLEIAPGTGIVKARPTAAEATLINLDGVTFALV